MVVTSAMAWAPPTSDWPTRSAPQSASPMLNCRSTAATEVRSINSSTEGFPQAAIVEMAWPARSASGNVATMVVGTGGGGRRRSRTSVITPSVPSLPVKSRLRS